MDWQPIETAPQDFSAFVAWDPRQGRCIMRRKMRNGVLFDETWAIDPSGRMVPPEPILWAPLPAKPSHNPGIPIYSTTEGPKETFQGKRKG